MIEWVSGNVFIRPNKLAKAGDAIEGHRHNFDHTTIVFTGAIRITATLPDGSQRCADKRAPGYLLIRKDVTHRIEALEPDSVFWCVYSHRTPQGDVVQEWDGWLPAYV